MASGGWFLPAGGGHNPLDELPLSLVRSCRGRERGLNEVDFGIHPTVEGVHEAVSAKGGSLSCFVCGRDDFALEEVSVMGAGMA